MQDHATDPGVFIRSMATRGHLGGLALAVPEAVRLLDAVGNPLVIVETVGVGQVEVEIAGQADTTVVVVNPGWGDGVQANKAGLMEIADVFVINKADRQGVAETRRDLEPHARHVGPGRVAPTDRDRGGHRRHRGSPTSGTPVLGHRRLHGQERWLEQRRAARTRRELHQIVTNRLEKRARELLRGMTYDELEQAVLDRDLDPWAAADVLLREVDAWVVPGRGLASQPWQTRSLTAPPAHPVGAPRAAGRRGRRRHPGQPEGQRAVGGAATRLATVVAELTADPPGAVVVTGASGSSPPARTSPSSAGRTRPR